MGIERQAHQKQVDLSKYHDDYIKTDEFFANSSSRTRIDEHKDFRQITRVFPLHLIQYKIKTTNNGVAVSQ